MSEKTEFYIGQRRQWCANTYEHLAVVFEKAKGSEMWTVDGQRIIDFHSAYSANGAGHVYTKIVDELKDQLDKLTLVSGLFNHTLLGEAAKELCQLANMDAAIFMNGGAEAIDTLIKAARRYGHRVLNIPKGKVKIIVMEDNFHGRTLGAISASSHEEYKEGFEPLLEGFVMVPFNNPQAIEEELKKGDVAAVVLEPHLAEGGIMLADDNYLSEVRQLCDKYKALMLLDEIQVGLGRCGKNFAFEWSGVEPDDLSVGKFLGAGIMPVSAFLAKKHLMDLFTLFSHGSTYGGNSLSCRAVLASIKVLVDEKLAENADRLGKIMKQGLEELKNKFPNILTDVRNKGLLCGIELNPSVGVKAMDLCKLLIKNGLATGPAHTWVVRLTPALNISDELLKEGLGIIEKTLQEIDQK